MRKLKKVHKRIRKVRTKFKKQRCKYVVLVNDEGEVGARCKNYAVGSSTLCKKHGGDPVEERSLVSYSDMSLIVSRTTFNPAVHPVQFLELSQAGKSVVECAAEMGVSSVTLKNWSEKFKEFAFVFELGQDLHEAHYMRIGKANLTNTRFQTGLFKWLTTNKLGYAEKTESSHHTQNTNVGVLLIPGQMSVEEWEQKNIKDDSVEAEYEEINNGKTAENSQE